MMLSSFRLCGRIACLALAWQAKLIAVALSWAWIWEEIGDHHVVLGDG